jgi:hypothetical protein
MQSVQPIAAEPASFQYCRLSRPSGSDAGSVDQHLIAGPLKLDDLFVLTYGRIH